MTIRTLIFCDVCNPLGLRTENDGFLKNRRETDFRTWYEGGEKDAEKSGWTKTAGGRNLCPKCQQKNAGNNMADYKNDSSRRFVGLSRKP